MTGKLGTGGRGGISGNIPLQIMACHTTYKVTIVVFFLLSYSLASEFYVLMFRKTLSFPSL